MYKKRFGLRGHPLPKDANAKTFYAETQQHRHLERAFDTLLDDRGLGVLTGGAGLGKTAAIRELCRRLPSPDYRVLYLCDTAVSPLDLYRMVAIELGVTPSHRRSQLWSDIKKALMHLVDEQATTPVLVLDEAQHLSDRFLIDLSGFLNFAFDSRDLLVMWLVGMPSLARNLKMQLHSALAMRVAVHVHLQPLDRDDFAAMINHGLTSAGATDKLLSEPAFEMLLRASHGVPRVGSKLLRASLREAHQRDQAFVDEHVVEAVLEHIGLAAAVSP